MTFVAVVVVLGSLLLAAVFVLAFRWFRAQEAGTGMPQWRAEAAALPRAARRRIMRATMRGEPVAAEHAALAARYGTAVLALRERLAVIGGRRWVRVVAGVAVTFWVLYLGLSIGLLVTGRGTVSSWSSLVGGPVLIALYVQVLRGRLFTARSQDRIERAVRLNRQLAAEGA